MLVSCNKFCYVDCIKCVLDLDQETASTAGGGVLSDCGVGVFGMAS
jgi:hypothetical protein